LLEHIDHPDCSCLGLQPGKQGDQGIRYRRSVIDEPGEYSINIRLQSRVRVEPGSRSGTALLQPLQAKEDCVGQGFGQALGEPRLSAA
jgi:hypothetical protein